MKTGEVVIVGGGMAGCLAAYYLGAAGVRTVLIERSDIGSQSSGNSAGGLNPLHGPGIPGALETLAMESFDLHLALWEHLGPAGLAGVCPRRVERLFIAFDEGTLAACELSVRRYNRHHDRGFESHLLAAAEVANYDRRIHPEVYGAQFTQGNAAVEPLAYTRAIARAAVRRGSRILNAAATGLVLAGNRAEGVKTDQGVVSCDHVVIATGCWGGEPSDWLGVSVPVAPLKGEMLILDLPGGPLSQDLTHGKFSLFSRGDGFVWLGATETVEGYDVRPTASGRRELLAQGSRMLPVISDAQVVGHTVGLRPVTPDGLPMVGKVPGFYNVYLNTGAGTKGTLLSSGMGRAIADLITQETSPLSIRCADPARLIRSSR